MAVLFQLSCLAPFPNALAAEFCFANTGSYGTLVQQRVHMVPLFNNLWQNLACVFGHVSVEVLVPVDDDGAMLLPWASYC